MSKVPIVKGIVIFVATLGGSVSGLVVPNPPACTSDWSIPLGRAGPRLRLWTMDVGLWTIDY